MDLDKEILNAAKDGLKEIAKSVQNDLEEYSLSAIQSFYLDYDPSQYNRWHAMFLTFPFVLNYGKIKETNDGYEVRMKYTYDDLYAYHNEKSYYVFNGPFVQGYHGGPRRTATGWQTVKSAKGNYYKKATGYEFSPAPRMWPSPWQKILQYAKYRYNGQEI